MHRALHWWTALAAAAVVVALGCATAAHAATTWHDNRGGTYSTGNYLGAIGGGPGAPPLPVWTIAGTPLTCTPSFSGSISAGTASGTAGSTTAAAPWVNAMTGTMVASCLNGANGYRLTCVFGWTAANYNANTPTTYLGSAFKITEGTWDLTAANGNGCALRATGTLADCKVITGTMPVNYRNPRTLTNAIPDPMATTSADGTIMVPALGAPGLTAATGVANCAGIGNGAVTISAFTMNVVNAQPQAVFWVTTP